MNKLRDIWAKRKVRFTVVSILYVLWFVIWTENFWWLLGLICIYDYYFTRYIDILFLNKYRAFKAKSKLVKMVLEWGEALLYAVVVVVPLKLYFFGLYIIPSSSMEHTLLIGDYLFVNKLHYGPRMANTPLSFPFVQHTLPLTEDTQSWVDWVTFDYKRLKGTSDIQNDDVVVFNFPAGDTVALYQPNSTYYDLIRNLGREAVYSKSKVVYRPVDKRENYIKRCVAIAGDSLEVVDGIVNINGKPQKFIPGIQYMYMVQTNGSQLGVPMFEKFGVVPEDVSYDQARNTYYMPVTEQIAKEIESLRDVVSVERYINKNYNSDATFPHRPELYPWNEDNYGPLWIPKAGVTVELTMDNLPLYERIIKNYELNDLQVSDSTIRINGAVANSYTFKMDYYFMMGDNRHNSLDSRYWGFVPLDHVDGKASFVWLSITPGESIFKGIRWSRMFRSIN